MSSKEKLMSMVKNFINGNTDQAKADLSAAVQEKSHNIMEKIHNKKGLEHADGSKEMDGVKNHVGDHNGTHGDQGDSKGKNKKDMQHADDSKEMEGVKKHVKGSHKPSHDGDMKHGNDKGLEHAKDSKHMSGVTSK